MNGLASARGAGSAALRVTLLAAMLMLAAGTSQAAPERGRGSGRGAHTNGGGGRTYSGGGGHTYSGGGGRTYVGSRGGAYADRGGRSYGGGGRYYGGVRYLRPVGRYYGPFGYRYIQPRAFVSFGIGLGLPSYYRPAYRYYAHPYPIEAEAGTPIDVENEPPAGCYYYDRFCDRQFSNLDDYTDHIESQDHANTIEIVQKNSGDILRTLEFVNGSWRVKE